MASSGTAAWLTLLRVFPKTFTNLQEIFTPLSRPSKPKNRLNFTVFPQSQGETKESLQNH